MTPLVTTTTVTSASTRLNSISRNFPIFGVDDQRGSGNVTAWHDVREIFLVHAYRHFRTIGDSTTGPRALGVESGGSNAAFGQQPPGEGAGDVLSHAGRKQALQSGPMRPALSAGDFLECSLVFQTAAASRPRT